MPSREEDATNVKAVNVGRQHTADEENAIDEAICAEVVEKSHGKRWEEDVEESYADAVAECAKHYC